MNENGKLTEAELIRQLGELPRRVEPERDPWSDIERRISSPSVRRPATKVPWMALAAAIALAFAIGVFTGNTWQSGPMNPLPGDEIANVDDVSNLGGILIGTELEYQAAFGEFARIAQSAPELKPATLEAIENDWQAMLEAESALGAALEQYPNNPWLNQRMLELRNRQLGMLKQLAGLERTSRRTEI